MSIIHSLYVGPYAEWLRPARDGEIALPTGLEPLLKRFVRDADVFELATDMGDVPVADRGGAPHFCYRFLPAIADPLTPPRRFADKHGAQAGALDLTDTDRQGEIAWFGAAYREPLAELAGCFGTPPALRWGVLTWYS